MKPEISATLKYALCALSTISTLAMVSPAKADATYAFETLSATIDGTTTNNLSAFGQIVVLPSALSADYASVTTSNPDNGTPVETSDGVISASFGFLGPVIDMPDGVIDFSATFSGNNMIVDPDNIYGGFFSDAADTDGYYAVADGAILTITYGTDNPGSPCFGPENPSIAHCSVTGEFVLAGDPPGPVENGADPVPEPATLPLLLANLSLFGMLVWRRRSAASRAPRTT